VKVLRYVKVVMSNLHMEPYPIDDLIITLSREGARKFSKVSFPIRYGRYSEILTPDSIFQFNLNGEIKHIQGRRQSWPNPAEWLKRTVGNDWVYYSAGDYKGVYELFGEYYFPCLSYPSNPLVDDNPFEKEAVKSTLESCKLLQSKIRKLIRKKLPQDLKDFLTRVSRNNEEGLRQRSEKLHQLIGGPITVLPPDTRHVDYEVIPLIVADGCLYKCGFCRVKSGKEFHLRSFEDIIEQIKNLKEFYARDLLNYNSIFLGQHDALQAGREVLEFTAQKAYETFKIRSSFLNDGRLFLFGSIDSFISADDRLFQTLGDLPFHTYINIGLESADISTLAALKKPVAVEKVYEAFMKMMDVNKRYETIEVTANFVYGTGLPEKHLSSFLELIQRRADSLTRKGTLYLSPLIPEQEGEKENRRTLLRRFYKIKAQSPLPTYLYLIQRL
jgi:Radical SAM superfamily